MREISFRGKRIDNGEWTFGNLICCGDDDYRIGEPINHGAFKVDPETVGQYIGSCDINGVPIFEGDILIKLDHWDPSVINAILYITYEKHSFCSAFIRVDGTSTTPLDPLDDSEYDEGFALSNHCVVATNVHDHKNLEHAYRYIKEKYNVED